MPFDRRAFIHSKKRVVCVQEPLRKLRPLVRAKRFNVHHKHLQVLRDPEHRIKGLGLRLLRAWVPDRHAIHHVIRHVLRDLKLEPVTVHALGRHDQSTINLALIVEHRNVVDQHEALARTGVGKKRTNRLSVEPLQVSLLMQEGFVFKRKCG